MALTIEEVAAVSRRVAAEVDPLFTVVAVTSADGEAGRVELLITIQGCHHEPCQLIVNLPRGERAALESTLRKELSTTLRQHAGKPS